MCYIIKSASLQLKMLVLLCLKKKGKLHSIISLHIYVHTQFNQLFFLSFTMFFNLTDSIGPVSSTIDLNTELCVCSRLYGVSYSITFPDDKTCEYIN